MLRELNTISLEFKRSLEHNNIRGYAISLDFNNLGKIIKTTAKFTSGDRNTSIIAIQLLNNGHPIILEESTILYANVERPDGTLVTNKCEVLDGSIGAILVPLNALTMEIEGTPIMDITLRHLGNEKIVSPKISFKIYESNDTFYDQPEDSEVNVLDVLVDEVVALKNSVINTNNTILQEAEERKVIEAEYDKEEVKRKSQELERQRSNEAMIEAETIRVSQELERQESMKNMTEEFLQKVSVVDEKIKLSDLKLTEMIDSEKKRESQHLERINEFDSVIRVDHEKILQSETSRVKAETQRNSSENERKDFFNEFKEKDKVWESQEESRVNAESSRVQSFKNMTSTFDSKVQIVDGKISAISEKISEANQKITQFTNDEATRKSEHSARVNKFDNEIVVKHQEMVSEESTRKSQESARVTAENERKSFYTQTQTAESARVTADAKREEKVRTLEARVDSKINETSNHVRTLEARVDEKIDETDAHVITLEDRVTAKINEYNTATLITNAEIDTIIANALR